MTKSRYAAVDTPPGGTSPAVPSPHPARGRRDSGPGPGWVAFAATMLLLVGGFNLVVGLAALLRGDLFVTSPVGLLVFDITGWGWIHIAGGVLLVLTGGGVFTGNALARTAAVVLAGLNALAQLAFLPAFPLWALVVIVLDVVVIAALLGQGTAPLDGPRAGPPRSHRRNGTRRDRAPRPRAPDPGRDQCDGSRSATP